MKSRRIGLMPAIVLAALVFLASARRADAAPSEAPLHPLRLIVSGGAGAVTGGARYESEAVCVYDLTGPLALSLRASFVSNSEIGTAMLQPGLVAVWAPGLYSEIVAGPAYETGPDLKSGSFAIDGYLETDYEFGDAFVSGRLKARSATSASPSFFVASAGGGFAVLPSYTIKPRFYFGASAAGEYSVSAALGNDLFFGPFWGFSAGGSFGYERKKFSEALPWGLSLALRFRPTELLVFTANASCELASGGSAPSEGAWSRTGSLDSHAGTYPEALLRSSW